MFAEFIRVIGLIALLGIAAALVTPKGRLPLALRGVYRILKKDRGESAVPPSTVGKVAWWRRLLAFFLVFFSILTALIRF